MLETMYESEPHRDSNQEQARIQLLLHHRRNRELLAAELESAFSVQSAEPIAEGEDVDLVVVDDGGLAANYADLQARQQRSDPIIQSSLLVTRKSVSEVDSSAWKLVDDVITTPLSPAELYPRINSLLRLRRLSIECKQKRQLEQVAGRLSHDIRNPLSVAQGHLDLAQKSGDTEHFDQIRRALGRIEELVEDVLTLAKQEYTAGDFSDVLLKEAAAEVWNECDTKNADIDVDGDPVLRIHANRSMLKELLANLFKNAIEHNPLPVTVTAGSFTDGFYVADDGNGIPKSERSSVFELGHSTQSDGTGIGLTIVTQVVDAHGWTISITESTDGGARFEITGVTVKNSRSSGGGPN
jgi:signal transduction histidine kinase